MKKNVLFSLFVLCASFLSAENYVYVKGGHNEYHIPVATQWDFDEFHPGGTIGFGYPFAEGEHFALFGNLETGYNNQSAFQDAGFVHGLLSGEVKLFDFLEYKLALGGGGLFLIQKGVFNSNKNNEYTNFYIQPALQFTCQTGLRFRVPQTESFYFITEYEMQAQIFAANLPDAISPVLPSSSLSLGILWKLGAKQND